MKQVYTFVFALAALAAHGAEITAWEAGGAVATELNRSFYAAADYQLWSALSFKAIKTSFTVSVGFSAGAQGSVSSVKDFSTINAQFPLPVPLSLKVQYLYALLPQYESHLHSLLPLVALSFRYAGIAIGPAWHFTLYAEELVSIDNTLAFAVYANVYKSERVCLGFECANYSDFQTGTTGSYFLSFYARVGFTERVLLFSSISLLQSGSIGLSASFYGVAFRAGVVLSLR